MITLCGNSGRVVASIRLFATINHGLLLSDTYTGPSRTLTYCRDPCGASSSSTVLQDTPSVSKPLELLPAGALIKVTVALPQLLAKMQYRAAVQAVLAIPETGLPDWEFQDGSLLNDLASLERAIHRMATSLMGIMSLGLEEPEANKDIFCHELSASVAMATVQTFGMEPLTDCLRERVSWGWYGALADAVMQYCTWMKKP